MDANMWRYAALALYVCALTATVNESDAQETGTSANAVRGAGHQLSEGPQPTEWNTTASDGFAATHASSATAVYKSAATHASSAAASESNYRTFSVGRVINGGTYPTVRLTGFFQADAGWVHQSSTNRAAIGDAEDGADFRRARLQAVGDVWDNVGYSVEFDFGFPGRPSFMDVWLEVREVFDDSNVRVGLYRQPIGLDGLTSVKGLTFIERSLPFALIPFRQIGGMWHGTARDETMTWAASVFRFPTDFFGGNTGDNGGYGFATRVTGLLLDEEDSTLVHIGGAFSFFDPSDDAVRYLSQPEFFIAETGGTPFPGVGLPSMVPPFVDTGVIPTDNVSLFGGEFAGRSGSLHWQSEVIVAVVNHIGDGSAVLPGASVQAAYLLTGEVRPYNRKAGVLGRITPREPFGRHGGRGAWEVGARWSFLDLDDSGFRGGVLHDITLGVNWYLNRHTKFQFNYIHAFLDSPVNGDSHADIVAVRAQLDF